MLLQNLNILADLCLYQYRCLKRTGKTEVTGTGKSRKPELFHGNVPLSENIFYFNQLLDVQR
jgi:hypothetical protein